MKPLIYIYITLIFGLAGCELFSTRSPEQPDSSLPTFYPPTSAAVVINNFTNAFISKNSGQYRVCFLDSTTGRIAPFFFLPSAEADGRYPSLFDDWGVQHEESYFISLISAVPAEDTLGLIWSNPHFDFMPPDSALFTADYKIFAGHNYDALPREFSGTAQITIVTPDNGNWFINRWVDTKIESDTIANTWSILKAGTYN